MSKEKLEKLDPALVRALKQSFVALNVVPAKFSFIVPDLGAFEVECVYPEGEYGQMNVKVI